MNSFGCCWLFIWVCIALIASGVHDVRAWSQAAAKIKLPMITEMAIKVVAIILAIWTAVLFITGLEYAWKNENIFIFLELPCGKIWSGFSLTRLLYAICFLNFELFLILRWSKTGLKHKRQKKYNFGLDKNKNQQNMRKKCDFDLEATKTRLKMIESNSENNLNSTGKIQSNFEC